jgi:hypothetical protein
VAQNHQKGMVGPLSKLAQVAPHHNLCTESLKSTESSGNPAFEGVGDIFPKENDAKERWLTEVSAS